MRAALYARVSTHDQQTLGGGAPALHCFQDDLAAVIHEADRQDKTRTTHRDGYKAGQRAQPQSRNRLADGARAEVVSCALVLPLGIAQPDNHSA